MEDLFYQFIKVLDQLGEIEFKNLFVDGTKIEANANKYSFVWKKATVKFENRLQEKIKDFIEEINKKYEAAYSWEKDTDNLGELNKILEFLHGQKDVQGLEFVSGKGKHKKPLQIQIEKANEFIQKQRKYSNYNGIFDGRNSFSKTDHDATFMHMKEDHMRNAQLKPGYNVQIGVEGGYVVGMDIFSERSDQMTFIPFLDKLAEKLPKRHENVIADAGYESEENYIYLEKHKQKPFVKPQTYEVMKDKSFKNKIEKRENMGYNEALDEFVCHNKKRLRFVDMIKKKSKSGYESMVKVYECENCEGCEFKSRCTKAKGNRQLQFSPIFAQKRQESLENITSPSGIILRMNRSIQVEGAFGVLKEDYGFRRFLTRGKKNVKIEFMLLCFGYNINKLHKNIQTKNLGVTFYEKTVA